MKQYPRSDVYVRKPSGHKLGPALIKVGDKVDIHQSMLDGFDRSGREKRRIDVCSGTVVARKGAGKRERVTVGMPAADGIVMRTFDVHSPKIVQIVVQRAGEGHGQKLTLRDRKSTETRGGKRKFFHPTLQVTLQELSSKPTLSAEAINAAVEEMVASRK